MKKVWIPVVIIAILVGAYFVSSAVFEGQAQKNLAALKAKGFPVTPGDLVEKYGSGVNPTGTMLNEAATQIDKKLRTSLA